MRIRHDIEIGDYFTHISSEEIYVVNRIEEGIPQLIHINLQKSPYIRTFSFRFDQHQYWEETPEGKAQTLRILYG